MRHKRFKLSVVLLLGLGLTGLQAQESTNSTGGNASGSGGTASYTVGQVVYTTQTGSNGTVAQGVQQPYEISVVSGIEDAKYIQLECSAYPNPATDYLILKVENSDYENLTYQLYNLSGKLLTNEKLKENEAIITMVDFAQGIYFLKVTDNQKEIKTFKIIKN